MKRLSWLILVYGLSTSLRAAAPNCSISIVSERFSGEKLRISFRSKLNSKRECEKLAQMHKTNFATETVKRKTVGFEWSGPKTTISKSAKKSGKRKPAQQWAKRKKLRPAHLASRNGHRKPRR